MPMTHYRPEIGHQKEGYYQGYYCGRCGAPGVSMYGGTVSSHKTRAGICLPNPKMVAILTELNTAEAEKKREFVRKLNGQPEWTK